MKDKVLILLKKYQKLEEFWTFRDVHAMWNDDGKGGHIKAIPEIQKNRAKIEVLNELLKML